MRIFRPSWFVTMLISSCCVVPSTQADLVGEQAVEFNWTSAGAGGEGMRGWKFSTNSDITITALGIFDHFNPNGLAGSHEVVIWDSNQQIVAGVSVPEGTIAEKIGRSRYVEIAPVILGGGNEFVIAAQYLSPGDQDWWATDFSLLEFDSSINFIEGRWLSTSDLVLPTNVSTNPLIGPNFLIAPVPEPSVALLTFGLGITTLLIRRNRAGSQFRRMATGKIQDE